MPCLLLQALCGRLQARCGMLQPLYGLYNGKKIKIEKNSKSPDYAAAKRKQNEQKNEQKIWIYPEESGESLPRTEYPGSD